MKVMLLELYGNGIQLAHRLVEQDTHVEEVLLVSDVPPSATLAHPRIVFKHGPLTIPELVATAKENGIDLVVNFNSLYGFLGVMEALAHEGIPGVGSSRRFSSTEIDKRGFKAWLLANAFNTPLIRFSGSYQEIESHAADLEYPLVIKPDRQSGPQVVACMNEGCLRDYLKRTADRVPYARFGVTYLIEEYLQIVEHVHSGYVLCGHRALLTGMARMPADSRGAREAGECTFAVLRSPRNHRYVAEITRFIDAMTEFGDGAVGAVQCAVTPDGELHFLEHNARPGSHQGQLRSFRSPMGFLDCLQTGDHDRLRRDMATLDDRIVVGIGLLHEAETITIDVERLSHLDGFRLYPYSINRESDTYVSRTGSVPSLLTVEGDNVSELLNRLTRQLSVIQSTGRYLKIDIDHVRRLLAS